MIYLKRLWNCIAFILSIVVFTTMFPIILIEATIIAFVYYVVTGEDYLSNYVPICIAFAKAVHEELRIKNV